MLHYRLPHRTRLAPGRPSCCQTVRIDFPIQVPLELSTLIGFAAVAFSITEIARFSRLLNIDVLGILARRIRALPIRVLAALAARIALASLQLGHEGLAKWKPTHP